jgi:hypothetical protein
LAINDVVKGVAERVERRVAMVVKGVAERVERRVDGERSGGKGGKEGGW